MEAERSQPSDFEPDIEPIASDSDWQDSTAREERRMLLSFAAVLVSFKLVGLAIIVVYMLRAGVGDAVAFLIAMHVPFVAIGLGLLYFPLSALYRRLRLRARRRHLIWAEWNVEEVA